MVNLFNPRYSLTFLAFIGLAYLVDFLKVQDLLLATRNKMLETDVNITWDLISEKLGLHKIIENITDEDVNIFNNMCLCQYSTIEF